MHLQKIEAQNREEERLSAYALDEVSVGGSGVCRISQKAFDDVVKENIEDFDMSPDEALKETINELKLQGADLRDVVVKGMTITEYLETCSPKNKT